MKNIIICFQASTTHSYDKSLLKAYYSVLEVISVLPEAAKDKSVKYSIKLYREFSYEKDNPTDVFYDTVKNTELHLFDNGENKLVRRLNSEGFTDEISDEEDQEYFIMLLDFQTKGKGGYTEFFMKQLPTKYKNYVFQSTIIHPESIGGFNRDLVLRLILSFFTEKANGTTSFLVLDPERKEDFSRLYKYTTGKTTLVAGENNTITNESRREIHIDNTGVKPKNTISSGEIKTQGQFHLGDKFTSVNVNQQAEAPKESKSTQISVLTPKKFSKGRSGLIIVSFYRKYFEEIYKKSIANKLHINSLYSFSAKVEWNSHVVTQITGTNIAIDKPKGARMILDDDMLSTKFLLTPTAEAKEGTQRIIITVLEIKGDEEFEVLSESIEIKVVDLVLGKVSRPLLNNIVSFVTATAGVLAFVFTQLGSIDKSLGLTAGTASIGLAGLIGLTSFLNYKKLTPTPVG